MVNLFHEISGGTCRSSLLQMLRKLLQFFAVLGLVIGTFASSSGVIFFQLFRQFAN